MGVKDAHQEILKWDTLGVEWNAAALHCLVSTRCMYLPVRILSSTKHTRHSDTEAEAVYNTDIPAYIQRGEENNLQSAT